MQKTVISRDYRIFLDLLREVRLNGGITQVELAESLEETQSFVSKCERGERRLDLLEVRRWCQSLRCPFTDFMQQLEHRLQHTGAGGPGKRRRAKSQLERGG